MCEPSGKELIEMGGRPDQSLNHPQKAFDVQAEIEGGLVEDTSPIKVKGPFDVDKHRGQITVWLIVLLFIVIIGHYVCVAVLEWNGRKSDALNNAFNASLPIVSGLVGSAVTYYFTKLKSSGK